jgi:hypothetical protein
VTGARAATWLLAGVTGVAAAVTGGLAVACLAGPEGKASTTAILPFASAYAARANADVAASQTTAALAASEADTRRELALSPRRVDGWLRLAKIETARAGRFTPQSLEDLRRSYAAAPYDPDLWEERLAFTLEHWNALDTQLRAQARDELSTTSHWHSYKRAEAMVQRVRDPAGRFAGLLTLQYVIPVKPLMADN